MDKKLGINDMADSQVDFKEAINKYLERLNNGSKDEIEKAKYNILWECSNFFELVINYVVINKSDIVYDFGKNIIPRGTKLYRIRGYKEDTDFSNPKEWTTPPHKPQNRANYKGQEALYLGSTETICLLEMHMKQDDKCVLGTYEVINDIEVGGYLSHDSKNDFHNKAGTILNSFLIAPARSERNMELFSYLDSCYGKLSLDDFSDMSELEERGAIELPMKVGVLNQREQFYSLTNELCNILTKNTPCGIRYSSCYLPLETIGIECTDFNLVLYGEGISKVKFINHNIKTNKHKFSYIDFLKILINGK